MKILYIAGSSRCGSTLLANILGELPGFLSAGELRFLWDRALEGRLCGCGLAVGACDLWGRVLHATRMSDARFDAVRSWQRAVVRLHRAPALLTSGGVTDPSLAGYTALLASTIRAIRDETGSDVLVDSSKHPMHGAALLRVPGVSVFVLHLVRDPRAVTYSRLRWKPNPDGVATGGMGGTPVRTSIAHWTATNVACDFLRRRTGRDRSALLRYEDFVADPIGRVERFLDRLGEPRTVSPTPFVGDRSVELGSNHTVSGNPDRFSRGRVELRPDDRWLREMRGRDRWATTVLTAPFLLRYGYPFLPMLGAA